MKQTLSKFLGWALVAVLVFASGVTGQILTGTITGTVVDPTDAVIPGAQVSAIDLATTRTYTAVTDANGVFTLTNLPNGFYNVTVESSGFAKFTVARVQVNLAQTAKIYAKMELAKSGSEVIVKAEQAVIETESAELKNSVDRAQIMQLPLPTRNPLDLVRTMPGIVTPTTSGIADAFVHGLRGNSTNITQDGVNVADNFVKTSSFFALSAPTVDSTGEFNVSIGGIGVDGGFGAAQVNIRTQRGSSDFHGSVFWYQRTNAFNANTWFNNSNGNNASGQPVSPRPYQLQNRIGVSAGGPVYIPKLYEQKDKTWLFGTYEAFREPVSRSRTRTVLSDAARMGSFTYTPTPAGSMPVTVNLLTMPGTAGLALNSDVMNFYNLLVPSPNTDSGCTGDGINIRCFQFNLPGKGTQDRYVIRADHQLFTNHSLEFTYTRANFSSLPDLLNGIEPLFPKSPGGGQSSWREVYAAAWHSTWGANKTNEVRFGLTRSPVGFDLFNDFSATGGFQLDLPTVTDPTLVSTNLPQGRNTPVRQLMDNFSWSKGSHLFRFGGEWRLVIANSYFYNQVVPRVVVGSATSNSDGITASDFTAFGPIGSGDLSRAQATYRILTGMISSVQQGFNHTSPTSGFVAGVPRIVDPIQHNLAGYFQDQWKTLPNLTVNYGVRYEYQGVFDLRNGLVLLPQDGISGMFGPAGVGNFFTPRATPVLNDTLLDFAGTNNGSPVYQRDINNFAPFLGFAWDPWKNGKTSIRGAGTVHFTQDGFTLFQLAGTGNTGLFSTVSNSTPAQGSVFSNASNPTPAAPVASFPVSQRANFIANTLSNLWTFDPALKTPYVIEWNLSVSRELWNRITVEARYVGNHAVKLFRSTDINEINILDNPFTFGGNSVANLLTEFQNAQNNLALAGGTNFRNAGLAGQVPLPIFEALFQGLSATSTSGFGSSTFITNLNEGEIGRMMDSIRRSNTYRVNREANFPLNFFVPNPFANQNFFVDNSSWSYYHGAEFEIRRRFSSGLFFQANYTFSKVLADARFLTSQNEGQVYLTLKDRRLDKGRAAFDITHSMSANFIYPLPFGKGKKFAANVNSWVDGVVGGWSIQGFTRISSGAPMTSISSGRITSGAFITDLPANIRNMTASELQNQIGVFKTPEGVFWLNPASGLFTINTTTKATSATICTAGQTTPCFAHNTVGQLQGNLPYLGLDGPKFVNQDFSIIKRIGIPAVTESFNLDIRFEFFNAFNHPNFGGLTTGLTSASFGKLTNTVDTVRGGGVTSRIIQWAMRVNW